MKKLILVLHFAFCTLTFASAQQYGWKDISKHLPDFPFDTVIINGGADTLISNLTDIFFNDNHEGWITTSHTFSDQEAAILHTTDGGETWEVQAVTRSCRSIHMVSNEIGYAAGDGGIIFKTTDGGKNWMIHGITGTNITDMSFPEGSDTGYACSYSASKMHRITPDGLEDILFDNAPFWWQSVSAPSHGLIWLATGTSVYTYNNGALSDQPVSSDNYYSVLFIQEDLGWGCGSHGVKERNTGTIMGCVGKDIPWVVLSYTEAPLYGVFALDKDHIWATGIEGQVYYSENASDFGFDQQTSTGWSNVTFIKQPTPRPDAFARSVFFTAQHNGYIAGNENILLKYEQASGTDFPRTGPDFEICPNPVTSHFTVHIPDSGLQTSDLKLEIVDIFGKMVAEYDHPVDKTFDISQLPAGIYFCRINVGNRLYINKIIKV